MLDLDVRRRLRSFELDVAIEQGSGCLALAGPSGAGKTSVLRMAAGLLRPDAGTIRCAGELWYDGHAGRSVAVAERRVGYLFQDYALFPHLSAIENVAYGIRGGSRSERRRSALELLERFGAGALASAKPPALSGGERQRVALARALGTGPRLLLLDEPLSALDARTRAHSARELAKTLGDLAVPALLVTHDFAEAAELGDRVAVLDAGRIVQQGTPGELAARPASALVAELTGASVLLGHAAAAERGLTAIVLDGGGRASSTDAARGRVALSVFPWEVTLHEEGEQPSGSETNHLAGTVTGVFVLGNRARVTLSTPQTLIAEVTLASLDRLGLREGAPATARWKATASRLVPA